MQNSLSVTALEYDRVSTEVARYRVMFCERKGVKKRGYKLSQHLVCVFLLKFQKKRRIPFKNALRFPFPPKRMSQ